VHFLPFSSVHSSNCFWLILLSFAFQFFLYFLRFSSVFPARDIDYISFLPIFPARIIEEYIRIIIYYILIHLLSLNDSFENIVEITLQHLAHTLSLTMVLCRLCSVAEIRSGNIEFTLVSVIQTTEPKYR